MSTDSVCGFEEENLFFNESQPFKPYKDYGKSKLLAEKVLKEYNSKKLLNPKLSLKIAPKHTKNNRNNDISLSCRTTIL